MRRSRTLHTCVRRTYASFARKEQPKSNNSFLLGAAVGSAVGLATALYFSNVMLPKDSSSARVFGGARAVASAIRDLQREFPGPRTTVEETDLTVHGSSSWFPMHNEGIPNIVVYPESTADVQKIARIASKYRVPVISYGAGTSIEGQFTAGYGGICIDFSGMDGIIEVHDSDLAVTLQPGVGWQALNAELDARDTGLFFPVDPGPGATIGGCIGTSGSGPNAARWGTMKDWVLSCTVVTIDGQVFDTRCKAKKSSTGYDLNHLLIGAEGTLGLVTEVTLRLTNKPTHEVVGSCAFDNVSDVTKVVLATKKAGIDAQCLELLDSGNMPAINAYAKTSFPEQPHLFFKLSGTPSSVQADQSALANLCHSTGRNFQVSKSAEEANTIWGARKNLLLASLAQHKDSLALSTDVCVPISKLPDLVARYRTMSEDRGIVSSILGHVADGNFHSLILYREADEASFKAAKELSRDLCRLSLSLGGTVSGEHGGGQHEAGIHD
ncbi:protein of unknown function [Taphrina deformans PYCC 5710]|uniref:D-lactate dehydrogenase (cytochrome) n=1 Tax=Taphrina deformans (strain PYCC 5710 / ATCC 11124 / CBS 356.35 / IMI 108563 / JCM 9778 / NBRC 8474) TaxID=1097556 RepID=R4XDW3_TAPDE|nr:protein of unknown function [Taphrina deformans PYCC 5710]|eukprot:CCG84061.1 protein of unknown function [Taphrina deformans PYCC 5710]